jgi:RsiW-degrading membrane proteinase PrsW (M82 family)
MWDGESIQMWFYRDFTWAETAIYGTSQSHAWYETYGIIEAGTQVMFSHTDNLLRGHALERGQTGRERL